MGPVNAEGRREVRRARAELLPMELGSPMALFSGVLLGLIGTALFMYGKKQANLRCLAAGGAISAIPFFIHSMVLLWVVAASCLGALWLSSREA